MTAPAPSDPEALVLIGGGEHARVVLDAARTLPRAWRVVGYIDREARDAMERTGVEWLGDDAEAAGVLSGRRAILALGRSDQPAGREELARRYDELRTAWATVVHETATVSPDAVLEAGVVVLARAIVNPGARIGRHAIVNTGAIVEHDVDVGPFAHLGPGSVVGGAASIGARVTIGLGARVRDHVTIGESAVVGMGAVVVANVPARTTVAGVPARPLPASGDRAPQGGSAR